MAVHYLMEKSEVFELDYKILHHLHFSFLSSFSLNTFPFVFSIPAMLTFFSSAKLLSFLFLLDFPTWYLLGTICTHVPLLFLLTNACMFHLKCHLLRQAVGFNCKSAFPHRILTTVLWNYLFVLLLNGNLCEGRKPRYLIYHFILSTQQKCSINICRMIDLFMREVV